MKVSDIGPEIDKVDDTLENVAAFLHAVTKRRVHIDIINRSTVLSDDLAAQYVTAIQKQVLNDFAPAWGCICELHFVPIGGRSDPGHWWIALMDDSTLASALGYHDLNPQGLPIGYVFCRTDLQSGSLISVTLSHEITEMLLDPYCSYCVQLDQTSFVALECGDPCLTGDTKIPLLNGSTVAIKDLVGLDEFWVYSFGTDGKPHPGRGHSARMTRRNAKVIEVELDNGQTVRCTPDHLFMLRNGSYIPASELSAGDSLMPLYRHRSSGHKKRFYNGYWRMMDNSTKKWKQVHVVAAEVYDPIPNGWVRHHIDFNKENNDPRNLQPMSWEAHQQLHQRVFNDPIIKAKRDAGRAALRGKPSNRSAESKRKSGAAIRRYNGSPKHLATLRALWADPDYRNEILARTIWSPAARQKTNALSSKRFRELNSSPEHKAMLLAAVQSPENRAKSGITAIRNNHKRWHVDRGIVSSKCELCVADTKPSCATNHKVVAIREAGRADVYDLTVDKWNNFAVSAGVVVHNCEADMDGYLIDGVQVSNFVLPAYFEVGSPGPWDHVGLLKGPMPSLRPDGYISIWSAGTGWGQRNGATIAGGTIKAKAKARPHTGSRRMRRTLLREQWLRSEPKE